MDLLNGFCYTVDKKETPTNDDEVVGIVRGTVLLTNDKERTGDSLS